MQFAILSLEPFIVLQVKHLYKIRYIYNTGTKNLMDVYVM